MPVYLAEELARVRLRRRLVDKYGVNLAGVQQLLWVEEVVQRIRSLADGGINETPRGRKQLVTELRRLCQIVGF
jgi:hypothetical protein